MRNGVWSLVAVGVFGSIGCSSDTEPPASDGGVADGGSGGTGAMTPGSGGSAVDGGKANGNGGKANGSGGKASGSGGKASASGGGAQGGAAADGGPSSSGGGSASAGGTSSGGADAGGGRPDAGGDGAECPPECLVANECVSKCGEEPTNYGCCPCPPDQINARTCGSPGDGVSCDPRRVTCRAAPPSCSDGNVPSVRGTCWGPCVPIGECVCDRPEACPAVEMYTCHNFAKRCGPYL